MDTIRETDGLAMSSRNAYLKPDERAAASILYRSLHAAKGLYEKEGHVVKSSDLVSIVESGLKSEPLVSEIQYISVDSKETMQPISDQVDGEGAIISLACKVGAVRLIDNIIL